MLAVIKSMHDDEECFQIKWAAVAKEMEDRNSKQCRERWHNHLRPEIKKGSWTPEENATILHLQERLGNWYVLLLGVEKLVPSDVLP